MDRDTAEKFWAKYDIPFEYDVGIKGRRSGLTRGSTGTGRSKRTVNHLLVKESFKHGRLQRNEGALLCAKGPGKFPFEEERYVENGEKYVPPITCKNCKKFMRRWKND